MNKEKNQPLSEVSAKTWLEVLKEQSWEAELLISTVAIFGTFQLFSAADWFIDLLINQFPDSFAYINYFLATFAILGIGILVACFIVHFIIRAYWVGLVGLNSVYSDYDFESSAYSKIYTERMVEYLPRLSQTIDQVDRIASVIFSIAISFFFQFIWGAFSGLLLLFLVNWFSAYISDTLLQGLGYLFLLVMGSQMIITVLAQIKKFKEVTWLQQLYFRSTLWTNRILLGPLFLPIMQVFMIFGTNYKKDKQLILIFTSGVFILMFPLLFYKISASNLAYLAELGFDRKSYLEYTGQQHWQFYADKNINQSFLLGPEIQSNQIKNEALSLFIPIMKHERRAMTDYCPTFEKKEDKEARRAAYLACYQMYHEVWLNGNKLETSFLKYDHPHTKQFGIHTFISPKLFQEGNNTLIVKKIKQDTIYRAWQIPFFAVN